MISLLVCWWTSIIFIVKRISSSNYHNFSVIFIEIGLWTIIVLWAVKTSISMCYCQTLSTLRALEITWGILYHGLVIRLFLNVIINQYWRIQLRLISWFLLPRDLLVWNSCRRAIFTLKFSCSSSANKRAWYLWEILIDLFVKLYLFNLFECWITLHWFFRTVLFPFWSYPIWIIWRRNDWTCELRW